MRDLPGGWPVQDDPVRRLVAGIQPAFGKRQVAGHGWNGVALGAVEQDEMAPRLEGQHEPLLDVELKKEAEGSPVAVSADWPGLTLGEDRPPPGGGARGIVFSRSRGG